MDDSVPIIEVENLTRKFNGFTADVSFSVESGETSGHRRLNGAGKMVTNRIDPTEGTARVGDHDVARYLLNVRWIDNGSLL